MSQQHDQLQRSVEEEGRKASQQHDQLQWSVEEEGWKASQQHDQLLHSVEEEGRKASQQHDQLQRSVEEEGRKASQQHDQLQRSVEEEGWKARLELRVNFSHTLKTNSKEDGFLLVQIMMGFQTSYGASMKLTVADRLSLFGVILLSGCIFTILYSFFFYTAGVPTSPHKSTHILQTCTQPVIICGFKVPSLSNVKQF